MLSSDDIDRNCSSTRLRALIIGGGGILGRYIATHLVSNEVHVTVHGGCNRHVFRDTIRHLRNINIKYTRGVWLPIRDHTRFFQQIIRYFPVDILIIIYGPYIQKSISAMEYTDWNAMALSNFVLPAACLSANMEHLQHTRFGRMIGFASDYRANATDGYREIAAYAAAKWALSSTIQSAALQNTNPHAKFYLVAPGYIDYDVAGMVPSNSKYHYCVREVANGVISLLNAKVKLKNGSTVELDRLL